jgi:hypothetical protein
LLKRKFLGPVNLVSHMASYSPRYLKLTELISAKVIDPTLPISSRYGLQETDFRGVSDHGESISAGPLSPFPYFKKLAKNA